MKVEFHIPKATLEAALEHYEIVRISYYNKGLEELMATVEVIVKGEQMPMPKPSWPVSYEDACDVVAGLHWQLNQAHDKITELERQLHEMSKSLHPPSVTFKKKEDQ